MIGDMSRIEANGIEIEYDTFGGQSDRPLLMIMGLGVQLIGWEEAFCERLVEAGHYVIRYDNRDVGLSTRLDATGVPNIEQMLAALQAGEALEAPYTLDEMADDAAGLLEALGIERAHICGASMGGMIAQTFAIRHPEHLRSLISIMSTTGNPELPPAKPEAMAALLETPPAQREGYIEASVRGWRAIASPVFPFDEARLRRRSERSFDRAFHPDGVTRHLAAVLAHGNRKPALASVTAPTLVIHGIADPLVPVEGGRDTAEAIPGAKLLLIEGMGHDLARETWDEIVTAIAEHTLAAEQSAAAG